MRLDLPSLHNGTNHLIKFIDVCHQNVTAVFDPFPREQYKIDIRPKDALAMHLFPAIRDLDRAFYAKFIKEWVRRTHRKASISILMDEWFCSIGSAGS